MRIIYSAYQVCSVDDTWLGVSDSEIPPPSGCNGPNPPSAPGPVEPAGVSTADLAVSLRDALRLPPGECLPGELAATAQRSFPAVVRGLDAGGWIAWCLSGLVLFTGEVPSMKRARVEAKRTVAALAMIQTEGNISSAARILGISRKVLRDNLRAVGLYPWRPDRVGGGDERGGDVDGD